MCVKAYQKALRPEVLTMDFALELASGPDSCTTLPFRDPLALVEMRVVGESDTFELLAETQ